MIFPTSLVSRVKWPIIGNYFSREFDVPENIIDLMETQIIFWLVQTEFIVYYMLQ